MIMSPSTKVPPMPDQRERVPNQFEATRHVQTSIGEAIALAPDVGVRLEAAAQAMPAVGMSFLGFTLMDELGKGGFGTVFLAHQPDLADRPVALKVSADLFGEPAKLARLQHAAIMPVYSTHETQGLQAVCMPFFGRATLADLYSSLEGLKTLPASGQHLVATVESKHRSASQPRSSLEVDDAPEERERAPVKLPAPLANLSRLTYIDAILMTGVRIAEGLAHAHERGIIHQDLKPANVLLTDEGLPMILDFNLARVTDKRKAAVRASAGGTIGYMSPEQLEQFITKVEDPARPVDQRSDIYSLGLILYQLLAGVPACHLPLGPMRLQLPLWLELRRLRPQPIRKTNPAVPPAVESIVAKCLEVDPARRYQNARELAEDIQRHQANLPLKHAPNPSLAERFRKWCRRHPRLASPQSAIALLAVAVTAMGLVWTGGAIAAHKHELERQQGIGRKRIAAFAEAKTRAESFLAAHADGSDWLVRGTETGMAALAKVGMLEDEYWLARPEFANLPDDERDTLNAEAGRLATKLARGWRREGEAARAKQLESIARRCLEAKPASLPSAVQDGQDVFVRASELQATGSYVDSKKLLVAHLAANPGDANSHLLLGRAHWMLGEHREARESYSLSIALQPNFAPAYERRARLAMTQNDARHAVADFDAVLRLEPGATSARIMRAKARQMLGQFKPALADINAVLGQEDPPASAWFVRAGIREMMGDKMGAAKDRANALKLKATDYPSRLAQGDALMSRDPKGAMATYAAAEKLAPRAIEPLQNQAHIEAEVFGQPARAVAILDRLLKEHPHYMPGLCGRAVYLARAGRLDDALAEGKRILALSDTPFTQYRVACVYALGAAKKPALAREALRLLARALTKGEGHDYVPSDSDLDPLRDDPAFKPLLGYVKHLRKLQGLPR